MRCFVEKYSIFIELYNSFVAPGKLFSARSRPLASLARFDAFQNVSKTHAKLLQELVSFRAID